MSTILRGSVLAAVLFWLIAYWQGGRRVFADIRSALKMPGGRLDALLMFTIAIASTTMMTVSAVIALADRFMVPQTNVALPTIGLWLVLLGICGMFYCRSFLGRFWTAETAVNPGHQVVDQGPYAVVRHPIYTCVMMMYVGVGLAFLAWWNLLCLGIIVSAYALKAQHEDRFLCQSLPGYRAYQQRVRYRLLPGIW